MLVDDHDRVRVADFGLAAHRGAEDNLPIGALADVEGLMTATLGGEGVLIELVQAPPDVIAAYEAT